LLWCILGRCKGDKPGEEFVLDNMDLYVERGETLLVVNILLENVVCGFRRPIKLIPVILA